MVDLLKNHRLQLFINTEPFFYLLSLQIMGNLGASDIDSRLEEQLIDGILYAFQEQTQEVGAHI